MSVQMLLSSCSTLLLYPWISAVFAPSSFCASFCSIEPMIRSDARRAPTTFLYATERRLRSSSESTSRPSATVFMYSTISSSRPACSASFAM